jgi:hypothetical protein
MKECPLCPRKIEEEEEYCEFCYEEQGEYVDLNRLSEEEKYYRRSVL